MAVLFALIVVLSVLYAKKKPIFFSALLFLIGYLLIGIIFYTVPMHSSYHHWIMSTPFQYLAITLAFSGLYFNSVVVGLWEKLLKGVYGFLIIILLVLRLGNLIDLEKALIRGDASDIWHPSLTQMAFFASRHSDEALFIFANWGFATSIFCFSNGKPKIIYDAYWNYRGTGDLKAVAKYCGKNTIYLLRNKATLLKKEDGLRIMREASTVPGWVEVPVDDEIKNLKVVEVKKFLVEQDK